MSDRSALFDLVHCLSKGERRYVSSRVNKEEQTIITYFSALKSYDEERFKVYIENTSFAQNTKTKKYRLQQKIVSLLFQYKVDKDKHYKLHEQVLSLGIYLEKGLMNIFQRELKRLEKICVEEERWGNLMQLYHFKSFWLSMKPDKEQLTAHLKEIEKVAKNLFSHNFYYASSVGMLNNADEVFLDECMQACEQKYDEGLGFDSQHEYLNCLQAYHWQKRQLEQLSEAQEKKLSLFQEHKRTDSPNYIIACNNYMEGLILQERMAEVEQELQQLEGQVFSSKSLQLMFDSSYYMHALVLNNYKRDWQKAEKQADSILLKSKDWESHINPQHIANIYIYMLLCFFQSASLLKAKKLLLKIQQLEFLAVQHQKLIDFLQEVLRYKQRQELKEEGVLKNYLDLAKDRKLLHQKMKEDFGITIALQIDAAFLNEEA